MTTLGYRNIPLSFNRRAVIASASVTKKRNTIHSFSEVDVSVPRKFIKEYFDKTGEKLSFTAYLVICLANVIKKYPAMNSFIKGRKQILLDEVTISVLVEREINGENIPEPMIIEKAQKKSWMDVHTEIRQAQKNNTEKLGGLSEQKWFNLIPGFLLKTFIRLADKNIYMARKYGKIAVTAVGMFSKEPVWFIPHGTATVLLTVGSISKKPVDVNGKTEWHEHLCLTVSFDHDIVDGAPAARFMNDLLEVIKNGEILGMLNKKS